MAGVLRIDQDDDITLEYVQAFRDHLLFAGFAHRYPHHSLVEIKNADVNRSRVDDMLKAKSIDYITAAGHGVYDSFTGQRSAVVWSAAEDLSYLHDKIVHLLSCQTGAILGRMMVKRGVSAFWGYTVKFMFYHQNPPPAPLHQDELAEAFLRMDIIVDLGILAGKSAGDIYDAVTAYVAQMLPKLSRTSRALLLDNYVHLVCPATTWDSAATVI